MMEPFSPEYFDSLYEELKTMQVPLDADPIQYGPKRLNDRTSMARNYATRCEGIQLTISQELQRRKRTLRGLKTQYDLLFKDLLANDVDVRSGKNVADRNATATMKLRDQFQEIDELEGRVQDLEMFLMVVKTKRGDLKDIQSRIRDQKSLVEDEIGLGGKWGQKTPNRDPVARELPTGSETVSDLAMIAYQAAGLSYEAAKELSNTLTPEVVDGALEDDSLLGDADEVVPNNSNEVDLDKILTEVVETTTNTKEDDDFLSLLDP